MEMDYYEFLDHLKVDPVLDIDATFNMNLNICGFCYIMRVKDLCNLSK